MTPTLYIALYIGLKTYQTVAVRPPIKLNRFYPWYVHPQIPEGVINYQKSKHIHYAIKEMFWEALQIFF